MCTQQWVSPKKDTREVKELDGKIRYHKKWLAHSLPSSCYTQAFPLLSSIFFRCLPISPPCQIFDSPSPNFVPLRPWKEGMKGRSPAVSLHSSSGPSLDPFVPHFPPTPHSPTQPPASTAPHIPFIPPLLSGLPCWAGDRPLNATPGVPDGSYRWSVVIGPIEPCHRLFPAKIQKLGHITSKKRKCVRERQKKTKSELQDDKSNTVNRQ